ncbi:MAG: response regulator transcription factor [Polyangiales bacterium]
MELTDPDAPPAALVVSDDPVRRAGLHSLIALSTSPRFAQRAPIAWAALDAVESAPAVIVADLDPDRLDAQLARLTLAGAPCVALVSDATALDRIYPSPAAGVISRLASPEALVAACWAIARGLTVLDPGFAALPRVERDSGPPLPAEGLTAREVETLALLAEGLSNKLIAARLGISEHTAKFHVTAVMTKLGATTRTEAVVRAARLGLVLL